MSVFKLKQQSLSEAWSEVVYASTGVIARAPRKGRGNGVILIVVHRVVHNSPKLLLDFLRSLLPGFGINVIHRLQISVGRDNLSISGVFVCSVRLVQLP